MSAQIKNILRVLILVSCACQGLRAQSGHYFLSHYKPSNDNISYLSYDIQQDNNGVLYFANRSGVLQFDGRTWTMVPINGAIYSLAITQAGAVYASGSAGFGRIGRDGNNQLNYASLSDSLPSARNIFASFATDHFIYFLNEDQLYQLDVTTSKARLLSSTAKSQGAFTGLFQIDRQLYVGTESEGMKKIEGNTLQPLDLPELQGGQLIFSERSPDGKTDLIVTEHDRFYLKKEGLPLRALSLKDSLYLASNVVATCAWVTNQLVAIGTLRGGVVFVDIESGESLEITNYDAGLPDNEVYALHTDRDQGVWVAHDYGFTRIAPFLPFRTFNHYSGLSGNLLCAETVRDQLYVGTTLGLFMLSKEEVYRDEVYQVTKTKTYLVQAPPDEITQTLRKKNKKALFGLRKKKQPVEEQAQPVKSVTMIKEFSVQKTRRVLVGFEYAYKRVEGITGKVDQMMKVGNKLLCGGVGGVFEINGLASQPISRQPARTIFYSKNLRQLLVSTYTDEIKSFQATDKIWKQTALPDSLSTYADYMFEDNLQNLWICGRNQAVKVGIEEGEILDAEFIPLPHTSVDRTVGLAYGSEVYLTQNAEFYHYASFKNTFVKYDSLPGPKKYFASAGYFWFYDGHRWRTVDRKLQGSIKTEWLGLFPDIRFLAPAEIGKSLWVITSTNELYRFSSEKMESSEQANPLFLKEVRGKNLQFSSGKPLNIDELESALTFEFIQPEYVSFQAIEYRYWVQGLQPGWSDWSPMNNIVNFPFLPPGEYKVMVQSKDLFGKVTTLELIELNVVPPYWQRGWFYALEFLFFGSLVVLSLKLNVIHSRYRYLSRFLSALTIIMLIQFIQAVAYSNISLTSTPVADFFIQVFIALLVLPLEEFLRRRILKAAEKRADMN